MCSVLHLKTCYSSSPILYISFLHTHGDLFYVCHCLSRFVLSVFTDSPRSTLTVTPDSPVFTGETVNLTCVIESYSNWRYEWYKDSVMLQTSYYRYTVNRDTLSISEVITSDAGQYTCKGHIDRRSVSSHTSSAVSLSVTGELSFIILLNKPF